MLVPARVPGAVNQRERCHRQQRLPMRPQLIVLLLVTACSAGR
jgi:hypothetical protein